MVDFGNYKNRRMFSDAVHVNMASKVYEYLNWKIDKSRDDIHERYTDLKDGIDYYVLVNGHQRTVQERFRTSSKKTFNDITFRYQYPENNFSNKNSEWFKITADYFLYGVIEQDTNDARYIKPNGKFLKLVVIDLRIFSGLLDKGKIIVGKDKFSRIENSKLISGFNSNVQRFSDNRSTFVTFDVQHLYTIDEDLVIIEKGYGTAKDILNWKRRFENEI